MLVELAVSELRDPVNSSLWFLTGLGQMAEALVKAERLGEALATVEQGIGRSAGGRLAPELLRIKGGLHLVLGGTVPGRNGRGCPLAWSGKTS
jgi:hypothetical protein